MREEFTVSNVKCGGCVKAIETGLSALAGVDTVAVEIQGGKVTVTGPTLDRQQLSAALTKLGYPESQ